MTWIPFPLHPETPEDGLDLADLFAGRGIDLEAAGRRLRQVAAEVGVPLGERHRTYNSRRAQELGKWAETHDRGDPFRDAVFRAYFVEGRNIARVDELIAVAEAAGLSPVEARTCLEEGRFREAVDRDWARARDLGVTAVPTHRCGDRWEAGLLPYPALERFHEACRDG